MCNIPPLRPMPPSLSAQRVCSVYIQALGIAPAARKERELNPCSLVYCIHPCIITANPLPQHAGPSPDEGVCLFLLLSAVPNIRCLSPHVDCSDCTQCAPPRPTDRPTGLSELLLHRDAAPPSHQAFSMRNVATGYFSFSILREPIQIGGHCCSGPLPLQFRFRADLRFLSLPLGLYARNSGGCRVWWRRSFDVGGKYRWGGTWIRRPWRWLCQRRVRAYQAWGRVGGRQK